MPLQQQPFAKGLGVPVSEVMQYADSTPLPQNLHSSPLI